MKIPINQLKQLYTVQKKTTTEIGKILGRDQSTISRWLKKCGIIVDPNRPRLEIPSKEVLTNLYLTEKMNFTSIGQMFKVSAPTVKTWAINYEIPLRTRSETLRLVLGKSKWKDIIQSLSDNNYLEGNRVIFPDHNIEVCFNINQPVSPRNYYQKKSKDAESVGIFVFHIFEYQWKNKQLREKIISQLKNLLGTSKPVYARKCEIRKIDPKESATFINQFHVQGNCGAKHHYGLFLGEDLLSVMTFRSARFSKKYEWELVRFCSKAGFRVTGGASKLFKAFVIEHRPKSIVSFSHIHCTRGTLYKTLGFSLSNVSSPSYVWAKKDQVLSRYQTQRKNLIGEGSENDIMQRNGFSKIYDCGNKVWKWDSGTGL
jgi:hypothetical protein